MVAKLTLAFESARIVGVARVTSQVASSRSVVDTSCGTIRVTF